MKQNDKKMIFQTKYKAEYVNLLVSVSLFVFSLTFVFCLSPTVSNEARRGIELCYAVIIPSVFPFTILSDLLLSFMHLESIGFLRRIFSSFFKINGYAITAFLIGLICGFPIGVKIARELYISGKISKNECERLIGFSNNASPSFVISGVGFALFGSIKIGIFLYLVSVLSSVISGILFSSFEKHEGEREISDIPYPFSFAKSVKSASFTTISICGFITFFSVITGLLSKVIKNKKILLFISSFLEIGNAANLIAKEGAFPHELTLALMAFAISFSGFSVHFQAKSLLLDTDISMKKYYLMKLLSGVFSFSLTIIILRFAK